MVAVGLAEVAREVGGRVVEAMVAEGWAAAERVGEERVGCNAAHTPGRRDVHKRVLGRDVPGTSVVARDANLTER